VTKAKLVQTTLDPRRTKILDRLAREDRRTRSGYVRKLLETHVDAMRGPEMLRALRPAGDPR